MGCHGISGEPRRTFFSTRTLVRASLAFLRFQGPFNRDFLGFRASCCGTLRMQSSWPPASACNRSSRWASELIAYEFSRSRASNPPESGTVLERSCLARTSMVAELPGRRRRSISSARPRRPGLTLEDLHRQFLVDVVGVERFVCCSTWNGSRRWLCRRSSRGRGELAHYLVEPEVSARLRRSQASSFRDAVSGDWVDLPGVRTPTKARPEGDRRLPGRPRPSLPRSGTWCTDRGRSRSNSD